MNELDARVFDLLDAFTPEPRRWPDWRDVLRRTRARHTRRLLVAVAAAVAVLACAAGVTAALGGFDVWLSGSPGKPAATAEQARFDRANENSIAAFPKGTQLRELIRADIGGKTYVLLGFRSGKSVCLRLKALSLGHSLGPTCAPTARVTHATAPILPVVGVGGFEDSHAHMSAAVSYGIAADGLARVVVHAVDGDHRATLGGNAYLWVENEPNTGQRALSITAIGSDRSRTTLDISRLGGPFATAPAPRRSAQGPSHVQAPIPRPTVGWYVRGERRGVGLDEVRHVNTYGRGAIDDTSRLVKPDPQSNVLVGLTGFWCLLLVQYPDSGATTSCSSRHDFWRRGPMNMLLSAEGDQFVRIAGVAADGVQRVVVFLADGQRQRADLRDNLFTTLISTAEFPAKVVAYDARGRVVGIQTPPWFIRGARSGGSRLRLAFRVKGPRGAVAIARVGRNGCWRVDISTGRSPAACTGVVAAGPAVWVDLVQPAGQDLFVIGHSVAPVARVQLEFANGDRLKALPVRGLFVFSMPGSHLRHEREIALVRGYTRGGSAVARQSVAFKVR